MIKMPEYIKPLDLIIIKPHIGIIVEHVIIESPYSRNENIKQKKIPILGVPKQGLYVFSEFHFKPPAQAYSFNVLNSEIWNKLQVFYEQQSPENQWKSINLLHKAISMRVKELKGKTSTDPCYKTIDKLLEPYSNIKKVAIA